MAKNSSMNLIGGWAFLIGILLAIVIPLFVTSLSAGIIWTLIIIGIVIGLLNVTGEEASHFMMSGIVLIIASNLGGDVLSGAAKLSAILSALLVIFVPATIVVAIRNVFSLAHH